MIRRYQNSAGVMTRFADALIVCGSWVLAYPLRFHFFKFIPFDDLPDPSRYFALLPLILILWVSGLQVLGVYRYARVLRRSTELFTFFRGHAATLILFTSLTYFITQYRFSRGVILIFGALVLVAAFLFRVIFRKILREMHKKGLNTVSVVAMGEGEALTRVLHQIGKYPELGISVLQKIEPHEYDQILEILSRVKPKAIMLALPFTETARLHALIHALKNESYEIFILPDYSDFLILGATVDQFEGIPMVQINESPLFGLQGWLKRAFDFTASLTGFLLLMPIFILVSILIKLTSKGSILYTQERMGLDGATFKMYKFRSMNQDAELNTGAVWASENDGRRTGFGKLLRSSSIDELPQLWNVIMGDMSLVGPRPERPVFVHKFKGEIPNYMLRHKVKTGITGWAQINGWRGDTSLEKRIECDLFYIRNWSFWLDIKILFLTVFKGFLHKNAY